MLPNKVFPFSSTTNTVSNIHNVSSQPGQWEPLYHESSHRPGCNISQYPDSDNSLISGQNNNITLFQAQKKQSLKLIQQIVRYFFNKSIFPAFQVYHLCVKSSLIISPCFTIFPYLQAFPNLFLQNHKPRRNP